MGGWARLGWAGWLDGSRHPRTLRNHSHQPTLFHNTCYAAPPLFSYYKRGRVVARVLEYLERSKGGSIDRPYSGVTVGNAALDTRRPGMKEARQRCKGRVTTDWLVGGRLRQERSARISTTFIY